MRYRIVFIAGLGVGFVLGARAGRERYEQIRKLTRQAWDSPAVQQAAGILQAQAAGLAKNARDKMTTTVPGMASAARGKAGEAMQHLPGRSRPDRAESDGQANFSSSPGRPAP